MSKELANKLKKRNVKPEESSDAKAPEPPNAAMEEAADDQGAPSVSQAQALFGAKQPAPSVAKKVMLMQIVLCGWPDLEQTPVPAPSIVRKPTKKAEDFVSKDDAVVAAPAAAVTTVSWCTRVTLRSSTDRRSTSR